MRNQNCTPIARWVLLALSLILSCVNVLGQDNDDALTMGLFNGRFWVEANVTQKQMFFLGFRNGLRTAARDLLLRYDANGHLIYDDKARISLEAEEGDYYAQGFTMEDHIKELDKLYSDRENIRISIPLAISYCALKLGGTRTAADLEQLLITYRRISSAPEAKKP
jgi:hypothetical protein